MSRSEPCPPRPGTWARALLPIALALFLAPEASFAFTPNGGIEGFNPVAIVPESPCSTEDARLLFTICGCNARFLSASRVDETHARADVEINPLIVCVQCQPDTLGIDLGRYNAGSHVMNADIAVLLICNPHVQPLPASDYSR
jgi:hypothetical protein